MDREGPRSRDVPRRVPHRLTPQHPGRRPEPCRADMPERTNPARPSSGAPVDPSMLATRPSGESNTDWLPITRTSGSSTIPKLLGGGMSPTPLTWAFASSVAKSSGYMADQRKRDHGSWSWSRIFCTEKSCFDQCSRRSGYKYLRRVTVTSDYPGHRTQNMRQLLTRHEHAPSASAYGTSQGRSCALPLTGCR
jgi:hypothetical protein